MAVIVPNALALANIADGAAIVASDHRNNYAAVQVGVNGLVAMFGAAATKGDLLLPGGGGSWDRLAVGANGQAVIADSAQTLGMKWATLVGTRATDNVGVANTDLAAPAAIIQFDTISVGTGTLRSIGAGPLVGARLAIRNGSGSSVTLKHQLAGGAGAELFLLTGADTVLAANAVAEFVYDGANWVQIR